MTEASNIAHDLLQRHAATPDHQLALPVDPAAIARAEGIDVPSARGCVRTLGLSRGTGPRAGAGWRGIRLAGRFRIRLAHVRRNRAGHVRV